MAPVEGHDQGGGGLGRLHEAHPLRRAGETEVEELAPVDHGPVAATVETCSQVLFVRVTIAVVSATDQDDPGARQSEHIADCSDLVIVPT